MSNYEDYVSSVSHFGRVNEQMCSLELHRRDSSTADV